MRRMIEDDVANLGDHIIGWCCLIGVVTTVLSLGVCWNLTLMCWFSGDESWLTYRGTAGTVGGIAFFATLFDVLIFGQIWDFICDRPAWR